MSTALIACRTTPRRPMLSVARYIVSHMRPTSDGARADDERLELAEELHRGGVAEARGADADETVLGLELDDDEPGATRREARGRGAARVDEALERRQRRPDRAPAALRGGPRPGRDGGDLHAHHRRVMRWRGIGHV